MNLREAATQVVQAYDAHEPLAVVMEELRAALAEPVHETIARLQKARAQFDEERRQALEQGKCWSCMQPLPEELKTEYQVNRDLPVGCDHCNHPLWCGTKCKSCGRKA